MLACVYTYYLAMLANFVFLPLAELYPVAHFHVECRWQVVGLHRCVGKQTNGVPDLVLAFPYCPSFCLSPSYVT